MNTQQQKIYRAGLVFIASVCVDTDVNDEPTFVDISDIAGMMTVIMLADMFDLKPEHVAVDVVAVRVRSQANDAARAILPCLVLALLLGGMTACGSYVQGDPTASADANVVVPPVAKTTCAWSDPRFNNVPDAAYHWSPYPTADANDTPPTMTAGRVWQYGDPPVMDGNAPLFHIRAGGWMNLNFNAGVISVLFATDPNHVPWIITTDPMGVVTERVCPDSFDVQNANDKGVSHVTILTMSTTGTFQYDVVTEGTKELWNGGTWQDSNFPAQGAAY